MHSKTLWLGALLLGLASNSHAKSLEECIAKRLQTAAPETPYSEIVSRCQKKNRSPSPYPALLNCVINDSIDTGETLTAGEIRERCLSNNANGKPLPKKLASARVLEASPNIIAPFRQNYILPYTYTNNPNQTPYELEEDDELMNNEEAKLQISLKVPLTYSDTFFTSDRVYFAFTMKSFWQVYNDDISAPFRETNYRPEVFYEVPLPLPAGDGTWFSRIGIDHESNGRTQLLSRSWNRSYFALGYTGNDWSVIFQPWHRWAEDKKVDDGNPDTPPDAKGDDNPDIEEYMGHYELGGAYRAGRLEYTALLRQNFDSGHGAVEMGFSFPLWGRLRGFTQYFDGYGESLIDYDHRNRRIGIGVLLTDIL